MPAQGSVPLPAPAPSSRRLVDDSPDRASLTATAPGWLVSLIVHLVILTILGVFYFDSERESFAHVITAASALPTMELESIREIPIVDPFDAPDTPQSMTPTPTLEESLPPLAESAVAFDDQTLTLPVELGNLEPLDAPRERLNVIIDASPGGGHPLGARTPQGRARLKAMGHVREEEEAAVALALRWLALHQRPDGSFSFDHRHGPCKTNAGNLIDARNGATGLALLPFLGAGQTHREGEYKAHVEAALAYLMRNMKVRGTLADLTDGGTMYSHGIGTIALCEAYAMTGDRRLQAPAQGAINYIAYAQDPVGGGWRYRARQPGDTSVVGWQLMALKSGQLAYLDVPASSVRGASAFLDSVQLDSGSSYGYTDPSESPATTSVGLLCRMYLGWKRDHAALERGVKRLAQLGPSRNNLYFNYYATQVLRHYGGDAWTTWNSSIKQQLLTAQAKSGAERGSWFIAGDHGSERGGRIYCTAMATMILEVYYRHLPIYRQQAADDEFPID